MTSEPHPGTETLARYARGELARREGRALEAHLAECVECQSAVDRAESAGPCACGVVRWRGHRFEPPRPEPEEHSAETENPRAAAARREEEDELRGVMREVGNIIGLSGEEALEELLRAPEHQRRAMIRNEEKFQGLDLCEMLGGRCREAWFDDPTESVEYAKLAVRVADRLRREIYGRKPVEDAKTLAWMHLGCAYRIARHAEESRGGEEEDEPAAFAEAEAALLEVRDAFLDRRMGVDAALATLDLALVHAAEGEADEVRRIAAEAVALFERHGIHRYPTDAMRFLHARAENGRATTDLLEKMSRFLQRARNNPELREGGA